VSLPSWKRDSSVDGELRLSRWMLGFMLAGIVSVIFKTFF
jgi:hypothetical protein